MHRTFPNHPLLRGRAAAAHRVGRSGDGAADAEAEDAAGPADAVGVAGARAALAVRFGGRAGGAVGAAAGAARVRRPQSEHGVPPGAQLPVGDAIAGDRAEGGGGVLVITRAVRDGARLLLEVHDGDPRRAEPVRRLLQGDAPRLSAHLQQVGLPTSIVTTSWFMCLFVESPLAPVLPSGTSSCSTAPSSSSASASRCSRWRSGSLGERRLHLVVDALQALGRHDHDADALLNVAMHQLVNTVAAKALAKGLVHDTFMAVTSAESDHILEQHKSSRRVSMDRAIRRLSNTLLGDEPGRCRSLGRASADFRMGWRQSTAGSADELRVKALDGLAEGGSRAARLGELAALGATSATPPGSRRRRRRCGAAGGVAPGARSAPKKSGGSSGRSKGSSGSKSVPGSPRRARRRAGARSWAGAGGGGRW